ncbi:MFS transporter [Candidatus Gottesmanbacteria bacterium RIFCSPHIGHO2_01_FULL_46_14]|uniref:MFS transporter n=2 Tax=Candidatus Gottesmaniibacteriota TaxID=1752720 RepID=A0A1F5ZJM8_9BACT|nr:MAG: MFS transporter [Candidatus Gottesmanbacteria bacterium RIFCSPHIGHO2_01_FULL_46_14]OGG29667.1 MAG: MFS transporter [Candidatus Gottesmanbacteria bacterium RIFCSPLOWO2_01_FULL_46_21]
MLYPVLPVFLTQNLQAGGSIVGLIEGIAQATQNIIQGFSGWLSDKLQKRKSIALIGYLLAAISKPFIGLASSWQGVLGARFMDRLSSGIRSAPRDALIAGSATENNRGKAFGLEGIGDNLGAFLGPLLAIFLLFSLHVDIRSIFYLALIPGLLAVFALLLVKEHPVAVEAKVKLVSPIGRFPREYWNYLVVTAVFGLGNSSNAFLILQTKNIGVSLEGTIFIYAIFNLIAALISYPSGFLSDTFGRKNILLASFGIYLVTYLGFAYSQNIWLIAFLFALYGVFQGTYRSVGKAFASDFVPQRLRASSIGWYSTAVGLSGLVASIVAGQLWDHVSHPAVFVFGALSAIAGILTLLFLVPTKIIPTQN